MIEIVNDRIVLPNGCVLFPCLKYFAIGVDHIQGKDKFNMPFHFHYNETGLGSQAEVIDFLSNANVQFGCGVQGDIIDPVEEPEKIYLGKCTVQDPENKKEVIALYEWRVTATGKPCFTSDDQGNNIVNINNYKMATVVGIPMPDNLASKIREKSFEFCDAVGLTGTIQDLLNEGITRGALLPDGSVPTGAIKVRILQEYAGQQVSGKKTKVVGTEIGPATDLFTLDGGQDWCTEEPTIDNDCDGFLGLCVDPTTPVVIPPFAGVVVTIGYAPCDGDDTDIDVQ